MPWKQLQLKNAAFQQHFQNLNSLCEVVGLLKDGLDVGGFFSVIGFLLVFLLDVGYGVKVMGGRRVCNVLLLEKEKWLLTGDRKGYGVKLLNEIGWLSLSTLAIILDRRNWIKNQYVRNSYILPSFNGYCAKNAHSPELFYQQIHVK